jgi:hypothetical protein
MRHLWMKQLTNERGATLIFVALLLTVILGAAAIAVDLGMLYDARNDAQKAADAAALAGASAFLPPTVPADQLVVEATRRAHEFGGMNRVQGSVITPDQMDVQVLMDENRVRVTVTRSDVPLWFARIFGRNTATVAARAAAAVPPSGSVECLRPMAFADLWHERTGITNRYSGRTSTDPECAWGDDTCDYYHPTETGRGHWWRNPGMPGLDGKGSFEGPAKEDDVGRPLRFDLNDNSGNFAETATERLFKNRFYPLRTPGCNGGACWRQGLAGDVCTGVISIGDEVVTEPGVQVGPTNQGFGDAFNDDPGAYWDEATETIKGSRYPLGCSGTACTGEGSRRIFHVAMVHPDSRILYNASNTFQVQNLGAFFLEAWDAAGSGAGGTWVDVRWMKPKAVLDDCATRGTCRSNLVLPLRLVE